MDFALLIEVALFTLAYCLVVLGVARWEDSRYD